MCGIAGIVSAGLAGDGRLEPVVRGMVRRLRHRGPDQSGVFASGATCVGTARLAIIDTRPIPQPMRSADGRHVIVFNGEAYNHRELRRALQSRGVAFRTSTDTEVVLEAYRTWGRECLPRLGGMFAFVILDTRTGHLFGARDRMGKKPFFVHHSDGLFAFASFLPSLQAVPGLPLEIDARSVMDCVELGWVQSPKSIWRSVGQIPPAHGFELRDGRLETFEYWSLAEQFRAGAGLSPAEQEGEADAMNLALREAVRERLIADVPLGALLSGGLDSSIVTALMTEMSPQRVKTFSVGFTESGFDERAHAERVARALRTEHHLEVLSLEDPRRLERACWFAGEPHGDTSLLPTSLAFEAARRHVTVALSGDGADELFAGYETFRADRLHALLGTSLGRPLRPFVRLAARLRPADRRKVSLAYRLKRFASGLDLPAVRAHAHWRALRSHAEAAELLLPDVRSTLDGYAPVDRFVERDAEVAGLDAVNRFSYVDLRTYMLDDILVKVDRASMGHSLEARCPFLDHRFVERAARLPGRFKLRGATSKWILRRQHALRLPPETLRRSKQGFSAPAARWLTGSLKERFLDLATPSRMAPLGLDATVVHRLHGELERREAFHGYLLWSVFALMLWHELHALPDPPG